SFRLSAFYRGRLYRNSSGFGLESKRVENNAGTYRDERTARAHDPESDRETRALCCETNQRWPSKKATVSCCGDGSQRCSCLYTVNPPGGTEQDGNNVRES